MLHASKSWACAAFPQLPSPLWGGVGGGGRRPGASQFRQKRCILRRLRARGKFPRPQILTIADLFAGGKPQIPFGHSEGFRKAAKESSEAQAQLL